MSRNTFTSAASAMFRTRNGLLAVLAAAALLVSGCGSDALKPTLDSELLTYVPPETVDAEAPELPPETPTEVPEPVFEPPTEVPTTVPPEATEPPPETATEVPATVPPEGSEVSDADCESAMVAALSAEGSWLNPDGSAFDEWSDWDDEFEEWLARPEQEALVSGHADLIEWRDTALFALFVALSELSGEVGAAEQSSSASLVVKALRAVADKAQADFATASHMGYDLWPDGLDAAALHGDLADEIEGACLRAG